MALVALMKDVPLNNSYTDVIKFSSLNDLMSFLDDYGLDITDQTAFTKVNFREGDSIYTSIRLGFETDDAIGTPKYNLPRADFMKANYLVVSLPPSVFKFYFITGVKQDSKHTYTFDLELDVMTTFGLSLSFRTDVFVERKHCDRLDDDNGHVLMNSPDALLPDVLDNSFSCSVMSDFTNIDIKYCSGTTTNDTNFNKVVGKTMWAYFWFKDKQLIKTSDMISDPKTNYDNWKPYSIGTHREGTPGDYWGSNTLSTGLYCLVVPLTDRFAVGWGGGDYTPVKIFDFNKTYKWLKDQPNLVSITFSNRAPFMSNYYYPHTTSTSNIKYTVASTNGITFDLSHVLYGDNDEDILMFDGINREMFSKNMEQNIYSSYLTMICITPTGAEDPEDREYIPVIQYNYTYVENKFVGTHSISLLQNDVGNNYDDIMYTDDKSQALEPKLYTTPYHSLNIKALYSNSFSYNELLLGNGIGRTHTALPTVVDIPNAINQKYFFYLQPSNASSPYQYVWKSGIGCTGVNIYETNTFSDKYADFISQNRNTLVSGLAIPLTTGITQTAVNVVSQNWGAAIQSGAGSVGNTANYLLKIDDIKHTPDSVKLAGNDILHDLGRNYENMYSYYRLDLLPKEKKQVYDFYFMWGYNVNRLEDFDNLFGRLRFNYVKLNDKNLFSKISTSGMNTIIKHKISSILNSGTTFWNISLSNVKPYLFTYEKENYEVVLKNILDTNLT